MGNIITVIDVIVVVFVTHADGSCEVGFTSVCVSVCFPHDIAKNRCSYDHQSWHRTFPDASWKPIYLAVKRSKSRVTKTLLAWVFALLWVLASS